MFISYEMYEKWKYVAFFIPKSKFENTKLWNVSRHMRLHMLWQELVFLHASQWKRRE